MHFLHNTQYKYRPTKIYDLDVIISVGYRVKSKRGTAFRIWARKIIKDYLVKGYAVNERIRKEQIGELRQLVGVIGRTIQNQSVLTTDETTAPPPSHPTTSAATIRSGTSATAKRYLAGCLQTPVVARETLTGFLHESVKFLPRTLAVQLFFVTLPFKMA